MDKHNQFRFASIIDELAYTGSASIGTWELYTLFNSDRISKNVWRRFIEAISDREEISEEDAGKRLRVYISHKKGTHILIYETPDWKIETLGEWAE